MLPTADRSCDPPATERAGVCFGEWTDGSAYEGESVHGLKHGKGKYTWTNGEYYEGTFYKDYRHGHGEYCWPTGHKFIGKYYLNRKEGYGLQLFPDGARFEGLYHFDQRFGPGVVTYKDGRQDVGLWHGTRLLRLCTSLKEGFSLKNIPGYASYMNPAASPTQVDLQLSLCTDLQFDDDVILPPDIESYSTDGDHLPLPPGRRRLLDEHFHDELWEPDAQLYRGYERDPLCSLPLQTRMEAHIHTHRLQAATVGWDVTSVLALNRSSFVCKGPLEVSSELLIQQASRGEQQDVSQILQTNMVHPDVSDSLGHTALIAATVSCHNDVIDILLNMGADIDKLNCEGLSALAVCIVLYYPASSLHVTITGQVPGDCPIKTEKADINKWTYTFDSAHFVDRVPIAVTEDQTESLAEAQSVSGMVPNANTQETIQNIKGMKTERRVRFSTLKLLLERGADPNVSSVPTPALFLAIMAADTEVVRMLLLHRARTDIKLTPEMKGLYPLHVAAALPGPPGPRITQLLLHTATDPDVQANDSDEICELDKIQGPLSRNETTSPTYQTLTATECNSSGAGGRTALHVACQRDYDYSNATEVVALLLSHRANPNLLWSGHSPLSLAIANGNYLAVHELLKGGADPNMHLGPGVGSALCALANVNYRYVGDRANMLDILVKGGADILMPVKVGNVIGTAVDYAHYSFNQDVYTANTPYHALNMHERETFNARHQLLSMMGSLLRQAAVQQENAISPKDLMSEEKVLPPIIEEQSFPRKSSLNNFCYECGRSVFVKLTGCTRCHKVSYCSRRCKLKAWDERHKNECVRMSAFAGSSQKKAVIGSQKEPMPVCSTPKSAELCTPLSATLKSPSVLKFLFSEEKFPVNQLNLKENYSCN
ncbi:ankyrin repeat and MYND domain-containing protein 1 [Thalassophryne amazonica]|uniref:ankyrin repeat and MYND domain-containing protein 1 n=1 Tax=Thalassophryne amazonica TaxID=390379 RepID=UPI00147216DC|nr:ankyrin repeat and MYND domain-containing protein 1 [Thalassophryne amazonica]